MVKAVENFSPFAKNRKILNSAMEHINSVPYQVTLRWVFYRLLQDGLYHNKDDYRSFIKLQATARKSFYESWRPDTLADDTREVIIQGDGWDSVEDWIEAIAAARYEEVIWNSQRYYIEVWFEAGAMVAQFRHYVPDIPLFSFRGDCSIAPKWQTAKRLEHAARKYGLPVVILYYGDDDKKGFEIPESAISDIQDWCNIPFEFIRGGLNPGDGERLGIPENIDKPGAYQWEALDDEQAGEIIKAAVNSYFDNAAADKLRHGAYLVTRDFQERIQSFVEEWRNNT